MTERLFYGLLVNWRMRNDILKGFFSLLFLIFLIWTGYQQIRTPQPTLPGYSPDSYSAYRAIEHLKIIAKEAHSGGTVAHKKVRNFIYDFCKEKGLNVKVYNQTGMQEYGRTVVAGNSLNILAKLEGSNSTKAVLVMAHYDSQPNTPGAADDGSGVASMLEVIALLSKTDQLKTDIYFLFTDLEESGLLGAEAFVHANKELQDIGMILNFEARCIAVLNFTLETTSENVCVIRELADAVQKPLANSLAYEIYKLMPNDTDFTRFRDAGISGLNSAFIDGYAFYHSPVDNAQNIDLGSLQHQGDLMWQMVNHFGNQDLNHTKSEDAIFFNIFHLLIIHPLPVDWALISLSLMGLVVVVAFSKGRGVIKLINLFKGSLAYLFTLLLSMALGWLLNGLVNALNPHYSNFYSNNFYNAPIYLLMFMGSTLMIYGLVNAYLLKKLDTMEKVLGALVIQCVFIMVLKFVVPTGPFIIYIPLLTSLILLAIPVIRKQDHTYLNSFLLPIKPMILLLPFIYILFVVFSLSLPFASIFFIILLLPYIEFSFEMIKKLHTHSIILLGLLMCIVGFIWGELTSEPTSTKPLQTQLTYALNTDDNEAFWISRQKNKDIFLSSYIKSGKKELLNEIFPQSTRLYWKELTTVISLKDSEINILQDSIFREGRKISIEITPQSAVNYFYLILSEGSIISSINERVTSEDPDYLLFSGVGKAKTHIELLTSIDQDISLTYIESQLGISNRLLATPLPANYVFGTGRLSNNMLVKKTLKLQKP